MGLWTRRNWLTLAALLGFVSVAAGAFGAHGASDPKAQEWLRTGALYGFVHVLATFAAAQFAGRRAGLCAALFLVGVAIFAGTLYAMALGGPRILGAVTPIGGLSFLAGWLVLAWAVRAEP
jgi:uncharacterized membrane protein YgdD (TMEM256/DUF423 family)